MTPWPDLPYDEWRATRDTLHMYTQVVGKLRLALCTFEPHWANVPLYLTARGLTTGLMPVDERSIEAEFDFFDHVLMIRSTQGGITRRALGGAVADFYAGVMDDLAELDTQVQLSTVPSEVAHPVAFPVDRAHDTYDPGQAHRFWRVLSLVDAVLKEHRAGFNGRTTAVEFFWGTFDLALSRFCGRPADPGPKTDVIRYFSGNAEAIACGWWPGNEDHPAPAFYAYAHPKPDGIERAAVRPARAGWSEQAGEFLLPYAEVRTAADPRAEILAFCQSTYDAAATRLAWPRDLTEIETPSGR